MLEDIAKNQETDTDDNKDDNVLRKTSLVNEAINMLEEEASQIARGFDTRTRTEAGSFVVDWDKVLKNKGETGKKFTMI